VQKLILVVRGDVNISPTVTNYLKSFSHLNYDIHCICSHTQRQLEGITYHQVGSGIERNPIFKLFGYYLFGHKVKSKLESIGAKSSDLLWVSRIDTALCLGKLAKDYLSVLALHELHDSYPFWRRVTARVNGNYKKLVYNETNRAQIARVFYKLRSLPVVIPNKPSSHPEEIKVKISDTVLRDTISSLDDKKIIIYQGSLQSDRSIEELVKASFKLGSEFVLLIMGKDPENKIPLFKTLNPNLVYIPWVIPPDHLNITSHAYIGVAFYDTDCLNSIYCAPNKIWEYSGFGIPVLGQNIPGLIDTVDLNRFGKSVEIHKELDILNAIKLIDENYELYKYNALKFYKSVDFNEEVKNLLSNVSDQKLESNT
jgi:hypothetical protein